MICEIFLDKEKVGVYLFQDPSICSYKDRKEVKKTKFSRGSLDIAPKIDLQQNLRSSFNQMNELGRHDEQGFLTVTFKNKQANKQTNKQKNYSAKH